MALLSTSPLLCWLLQQDTRRGDQREPSHKHLQLLAVAAEMGNGEERKVKGFLLLLGKQICLLHYSIIVAHPPHILKRDILPTLVLEGNKSTRNDKTQDKIIHHLVTQGDKKRKVMGRQLFCEWLIPTVSWTIQHTGHLPSGWEMRVAYQQV